MKIAICMFLALVASVYSDCGRSNVATSLVRQTAKRGAWPWQILILNNKGPVCGGTIINRQWIVTAAHCIYRKSARQITIRVGEHNTKSREGSEVDIPAERIVQHPSYNPSTWDFDIAMIKVSRRIVFNTYVQPACLPNRPFPVGTQCYVTGWGKISYPGKMHYILQQGSMPIIDHTTCYATNLGAIGFRVTSNMVCAGYGGQSHISSCHDDDGGTFVCRSGEKWYLAGAVSHGSSTCSVNVYSVYANVYEFREWIKRYARS